MDFHFTIFYGNRELEGFCLRFLKRFLKEFLGVLVFLWYFEVFLRVWEYSLGIEGTFLKNTIIIVLTS